MIKNKTESKPKYLRIGNIFKGKGRGVSYIAFAGLVKAVWNFVEMINKAVVTTIRVVLSHELALHVCLKSTTNLFNSSPPKASQIERWSKISVIGRGPRDFKNF